MNIPETITINPEVILWFFGAVAVIGTGLSWLKKAASPLHKPLIRLEAKLDTIETRSKKCNTHFEDDKRRLDSHDIRIQDIQDEIQEMRDDIKMTMKAVVLLMKHAETGNCTGEVGKGREDLEKYLIDKQ